MTDLERVELAVRRVAAHAMRLEMLQSSTTPAYWLEQLADELLRMSLEKDPDEAASGD